jgi:hypothetical protein
MCIHTFMEKKIHVFGNFGKKFDIEIRKVNLAIFE